MTTYPSVRAIVRSIMAGVEAVANRLGIEFPISIERRIADAEKLCEHKTFMLQDLEAARPMVQGVQVSAPFGRYSSAVEILEVVLPKKSPGDKPGETLRTVKPERSGVGNV